MEKLKEIISKAGLSTSSSYYSGRGAILSDLNSKILINIQNGIKDTFGEKESKAFLEMVYNMDKLSATSFLQSLYSLYYNDWVYSNNEGNGVYISKNEDGSYNETSGFMSMFGLMSGDNKRDETELIRYEFLKRNGKIKLNKGGVDVLGNIYRLM